LIERGHWGAGDEGGGTKETLGINEGERDAGRMFHYHLCYAVDQRNQAYDGIFWNIREKERTGKSETWWRSKTGGREAFQDLYGGSSSKLFIGCSDGEEKGSLGGRKTLEPTFRGGAG